MYLLAVADRIRSLCMFLIADLTLAGQPKVVALVAVMGKLLLDLNRVACRGTPWLLQEEWLSEPSS